MTNPQYYRIESKLIDKHGGKLLLTVDSDDNVIVNTAVNAPLDCQLWSKFDRGDGTYYLVSKQGGKNIQMGENAAQVTVKNFSGSSLKFRDAKDCDSIIIQDVSSEFVLDVFGLKTEPGTKVISYVLKNARNAENQEWQFVPFSY